MNRATPFTVQDIVRATQGALVAGDLGIPVTGVSIDSRSLAVGEAFFAIRGHRLDGHGFLGEAGRVLVPGGCLAFYAPLRDGDEYFSPGNRAFDAALRQSRPDLGLRDMGAIAAQALRHGLHLHRRVAMPANNHFLVLHAGADGQAAA